MVVGAKKLYGFRVFIASCVLTTVTIGFVMWDEQNQRNRRQEGVRKRLKNVQQQQNMTDYAMQKQKYAEYKTTHS